MEVFGEVKAITNGEDYETCLAWIAEMEKKTEAEDRSDHVAQSPQLHCQAGWLFMLN